MSAQGFVFALAAMVACAHGLDITVPRTERCGLRKIAVNYDLGNKVELCIRAHDQCNEKIPVQEELYGLTNDGVFPIFSCACESDFRECLSSLYSIRSGALGRLYFSTRKLCFAYGRPIVTCLEHQLEMFMTRCVTYISDATQPKRWQFYDLAFFADPSSEEDSTEESTEDSTEA